MQTEKITALYARFSKDENAQQDSDSIAHQKELLSEYAGSHGFGNCRCYSDDGYTGTNFERPSFKQMIADIENGLIGTVIVKDMSRLGRNYLMVGHYTEMFFPEHGVRLIAISDNVDSAEGLSDLIPFSNLINEWYAKDISQKMRAMIVQKGNSGKRLATRVAYGYQKSPQNKDELVVDVYAAEIVRRIFSMYVGGVGVSQIANTLKSEGILRPSDYIYKRNSDNSCNWTDTTVSVILTNPVYCGDTVNFKFHRISYKSKKIVKNPPEMHKVFLNTHPAIVDRETFEAAQQRYEQRCRRKRSTQPCESMFLGYVYCRECKSRLHVFRHKRHGAVITSYECSGYRKRLNKCTYHRIDDDELREQVLDKIRAIWSTAKADMPAFKALVKEKLNADECLSRSRIKSEITAAQSRIAEIDNYVQNLFEARVRKEIDSELFSSLSKAYMTEKNKLNESISDLILQENRAKDMNHKVNRLYAAIEKYDVISDLTPEIFFDFIERVEVGECRRDVPKADRTRSIDVFFIGVGIMNIS